jgi:cadmium resistance protein CadD (predicted permease)
MLTLIAYMLTLGSTLPRISYLTRADRFFVGSAILVFLGLVKAVAAAALGQSPRARLVDQVNKWGRWVFPLAMLANFLFAFAF